MVSRFFVGNHPEFPGDSGPGVPSKRRRLLKSASSWRFMVKLGMFHGGFSSRNEKPWKLMGLNGGSMGFHGGLMGFNGSEWWFNGDWMVV